MISGFAFSYKTSYGFIQEDNTNVHYFVHARNILKNPNHSVAALLPGERLWFDGVVRHDRKKGVHGMMAVNVTGPDGKHVIGVGGYWTL